MQCQTNPHSILRTPFAGHCLGAFWGGKPCPAELSGGKPCLSNPVWRHSPANSPDTICWTLFRYTWVYWNYHPFRGLQLQLSGVFQMNLHYSFSFLFFSSRMQLQVKIPLTDSQKVSATTVTWFNRFQLLNVMILKRMVPSVLITLTLTLWIVIGMNLKSVIGNRFGD